MEPRQAKFIFSAVVLAVSALIIFLFLRTSGPSFDLAPHYAIGKVMAEEAAKLATGGGRVTIIGRDDAAFANPYAAAELQALLSALRSANCSIASTNLLKLDPLRLARVPAGDYAQMTRRLGDKDVVVCLLGAPDLNAELLKATGTAQPKLVALCTGTFPRQIALKPLFDKQILQAAIVSKEELSAAAAGGGHGDAFDKLYAVVTAKNVDELSAPAK
jgi:hypothetical protein